MVFFCEKTVQIWRHIIITYVRSWLILGCASGLATADTQGQYEGLAWRHQQTWNQRVIQRLYHATFTLQWWIDDDFSEKTRDVGPMLGWCCLNICEPSLVQRLSMCTSHIQSYLHARENHSQQTRAVYPMFAQCWAIVYSVGPTLSQHWLKSRVCWVWSRRHTQQTRDVGPVLD